MFSFMKQLFAVVPSIGLAAVLSFGTPFQADAQTFRDRIQDRIAARQGARTEGAGAPVAISVGGLQRIFYLHVPTGLGARPGAVLVFHGGGGGTGEAMLERNPMVGQADAGKFIAVFPEAYDGNWTDGRIATQSGPDDVAYVRALVAYLTQTYGVDPGRVFATGISNGGIFTHKLACDAPGLIRAIAPVAGNMPDALLPVCNPGRGTPVMMFNGTADPFMPYAGGLPENRRMIERAQGGPLTDTMASSEATAAFWARINGCGGASTRDLANVSDDGTTVTEFNYSCGSNDVLLYRINGGGHTWPGTTVRIAARLNGPTSMDIDATGTMVAFFRTYGL